MAFTAHDHLKSGRAQSVSTAASAAGADVANLRTTGPSSLVSQVTVGSYIDIYWPLDDAYYPAKVVGKRMSSAASSDTFASSSSSSSAALNNNNPSCGNDLFTVIYTDGSVETLNLYLEKFKFLDGKAIQDFIEESTNFAANSSSSISGVLGGAPAPTSIVSTSDVQDELVGSRYDSNKPKFSATFDQDISEDVYLVILAFIPQLCDISSFGRTCKKINYLWSDSRHRERLLGNLFRSKFGSDASACSFAGRDNARTCFWQDMWTDMRRLRLALTLGGSTAEGINKRMEEQMSQLIKAFAGDIDDEEDEDQQPQQSSSSASLSSNSASLSNRKRKANNQEREMRRTMGILTDREEDEALYYDNPSHAPDVDTRYCFGYFGMYALNVPCHRSGARNGPPVAVWGDFMGARIFDSPQDVLYDCDDETSRCRSSHRNESRNVAGGAMTNEAAPRRPCTALVDRDGEGLVLAALVSPFTPQQIGEEKAHPCIFLGMSSGMVVSIGIKTDANGHYSYEVLSAEESHENEVTSLAIVRNPTKSLEGDPESNMLASSGVDGVVKMYRHAFCPEKEYSLAEDEDEPLRELYCFDNKSAVFSIESTVISSKMDQTAGNQAVLIATGNQDGSIGLRAKELRKNCDGPFEMVQTLKPNSSEYIITSRMSFIHDGRMLVTGSNYGDVRVWNVRIEDAPNGPLGGLYFHLSGYICLDVRHRMPSAHVGTIESIEKFGNIVLTSGGCDGLLKGWDVNSGRLLGALSCHGGRSTVGSVHLKKRIKSSVVGSFFWNKSLISLCRDGTIHKWNYDTVFEKYYSRPDANKRHKDEKDWLSSFVCPTTAAKGTTKSSGTMQKLCTMAELKYIMTRTGRSNAEMQQKMRLAIFKASVAVALQPDHKDAPFLGADGKLYESTKKAFAKYSCLQACASCRDRAQGAFFCRLVRAHELPASALAQVRSLSKVGKPDPKTSKKMSSAKDKGESSPTTESTDQKEEEETCLDD